MKLIRNAGVAYILALLMIPALAEGQGEKDSLSCCRSVWEEIHEQMGEAFDEIDWDKIREEMEEARQEALEAINWEEIREELKEAHVEMKEELAEIEWEAMKKELQQEMKKVRNAIDSAYRELERELQDQEEY